MVSLPGNDLIVAGIEDLRHQRPTVAALLVAIGAPKLRSLGVEVPENVPSNPEHRLYDLLSVPDPDSAHSKYNALIRGWSALSMRSRPERVSDGTKPITIRLANRALFTFLPAAYGPAE